MFVQPNDNVLVFKKVLVSVMIKGENNIKMFHHNLELKLHAKHITAVDQQRALQFNF